MKAAELRQAILQAAIQGKLVQQYIHDEPAAELLKRIRHEKSQLTKEGKVKRENTLPPIRGEEYLFDLPDGWTFCRLIEICSVITDGDHQPPPKQDSGIPFLVISNVSNGILDFTNTRFVSKEYFFKLSNEKIAVQGDILFTVTGSFGIPILVKHNEQFCFQRHIALIRTLPLINTEYLLYFLLSPFCFSQCTTVATGTAQKTVPLTGLRNMVITLPPLSEQQRIVAKVDELMALCDELEASEKELDALEKRLVEYLPKSILQAAVQGKLVPQNVHDEPASELLKRIQQEKARLVREGKNKKEKPLPSISVDEIPYDLPDGWVWCRINDICIVNPRNNLSDNIDVSFIPMNLISSEYFGGHNHEIRKWAYVKSGFTHFAENDVVLAKITPCFQNGKSCVLKNLMNGYGAGTTELHVLRSVEVMPEYILTFIKSPDFLSTGKENMTGTAGQQRVPTGYIENCLIPLPPLHEQKCIVSAVNNLMGLCNELKASLCSIRESQRNISPRNLDKVDISGFLLAARGDGEDLPQEALDDIAALFREE